MIRKAAKPDLPDIIEIENASFSDPWDKGLFLDAIGSKDKHFLVDAIGGKPAGYVIFEKVFDEGHITNLAVGKGNRRQGIASRLIRSALDLARRENVREVFLEVRESNREAISLYLKFGFSEIGRRKKYYPKANEDALILHSYICKGEAK